MANQEHVDILKQGYYVWNQWRKMNPDIRPNLYEADLNRVNMNYTNLSRAYLREADLREADLRKASVYKADLSHADLSHADLREASAYKANLSHADLREADLGSADLRSARLHSANLKGARLHTAYLRAASLTFADLRRADLCRADLHSADLRAANLRAANLDNTCLHDAYLGSTYLEGANLNRTDLREAKFGSAKISDTVFTDVDLSDVSGLETVRHTGPSSIGLDTIYRSKGQIPEVFLRGCGVDESFITYMRSLVDNPIEFYSCFISYSHADKSFARRLHDQLQARGIRCWLDEHQVRPGDVIYDEIHRGIRLWDKVLLCCSEPALTSWWVDNEVATAFEKEQELGRQRGEKVLALIPLDLDGALFKQELTDGKSAQLRQRLAADFTGWENDNAKFESQFEKVVNALKTGDAGREPPPEPRL